MKEVPFETLLFNIILYILAGAIRQENEMEGIKIRKGDIILYLFSEDVILYSRSKTFLHKAARFDKLRKAAVYKISNRKSAPSLDISKEPHEKLIRNTLRKSN